MGFNISSLLSPASLARSLSVREAALPAVRAQAAGTSADVDDNWCGTPYPHKFGPSGPGPVVSGEVLRGGSSSGMLAEFDDFCGTPYPGKFGPHGPTGPQGSTAGVLIGL